MDATSTDDAAVVGDECHIVGPKAGSPRHDPAYPSEKIDHCENLILLCRVHHKMVDDQSITFGADVLRAVKASHEQRVKDALKAAAQSATHILLPRIRTGRDLLHSVLGVFAYDFDHDEPKSAADAEIIGGLLQTAKDWGEVGDDLDAGQKVRVGHDLNATIQAVESAGYVVLGRKIVDKMTFSSGDAEVWPIAVIRVLYADNPILRQQPSDT